MLKLDLQQFGGRGSGAEYGHSFAGGGAGGGIAGKAIRNMTPHELRLEVARLEAGRQIAQRNAQGYRQAAATGASDFHTGQRDYEGTQESNPNYGQLYAWNGELTRRLIAARNTLTAMDYNLSQKAIQRFNKAASRMIERENKKIATAAGQLQPNGTVPRGYVPDRAAILRYIRTIPADQRRFTNVTTYREWVNQVRTLTPDKARNYTARRQGELESARGRTVGDLGL